MAEYANLPASAVEKIQAIENELKEQGVNAVLLAYARYASLSPEALALIEQLEETLKAQGEEVYLVAYSK